MEQETPLFFFGIAADIQYANKVSEKETKFYKEALPKFRECVETWNRDTLTFTVHLGDIIDGNITIDKSQQDLNQILEVFKCINVQNYHVIGNHCLRLPRDVLLPKLGVEKTYHSFREKGWRFIILDGTDVSVYGWPSDNKKHQEALSWLDNHRDLINGVEWNSAIGSEQQDWLRNELSMAKSFNEKVVIFCHYPLLAESAAATHVLWNAQDILNIFDEYPRTVFAYFNGHYHPGGYTNRNGVHFYTMKGILEAPNDSNCFGIVRVFSNRLEMVGFGTVTNQTFL